MAGGFCEHPTPNANTVVMDDSAIAAHGHPSVRAQWSQKRHAAGSSPVQPHGFQAGHDQSGVGIVGGAGGTAQDRRMDDPRTTLTGHQAQH